MALNDVLKRLERRVEGDLIDYLAVADDRHADRDDASFGDRAEEEVGAYVWAKTLHGGEKEDPVDKDNHGMDAKRYVVAYEDGGNEPGIRFLGGRRL